MRENVCHGYPSFMLMAVEHTLSGNIAFMSAKLALIGCLGCCFALDFDTAASFKVRVLRQLSRKNVSATNYICAAKSQHFCAANVELIKCVISLLWSLVRYLII